MKRRLLSVVLTLALCLTLLPGAAWAADGGAGLPERPTAQTLNENTGVPGEGTTPGDIEEENPGADGGGTDAKPPVVDGSEDNPSTVTAGTWSELLTKIANDTINDITLEKDVTRGSGGTGGSDNPGEINISKTLTINLNGHTLDTGGTDITVSNNAALTIENDPEEPDDPDDSKPGRIIGRIKVTGGQVTLQDDVEISGSTATNGDDGATNDEATNGGAIYVTGGTVNLQENVKVTGNTATNDDANDGDIPEDGTINDDGGNTVTNGGGIDVAGGTVNLQGNVEITGNTAENGGGIYVDTGGTVTIQENANVEITGNKAGKDGLGGGVYNVGTFTMYSGAIYGNSAGEAAADFIMHRTAHSPSPWQKKGTPGTRMNRMNGIRTRKHLIQSRRNLTLV